MFTSYTTYPRTLWAFFVWSGVRESPLFGNVICWSVSNEDDDSGDDLIGSLSLRKCAHSDLSVWVRPITPEKG
jgi:hypothetical protein